MKSFTSLIISLILVLWILATSILSIQNATPVILKFLTYESIRLPVGIVLAFSAAAGAIIGAFIALPLLSSTNSISENFSSQDEPKENRPPQTTVGADDWVETASKDW